MESGVSQLGRFRKLLGLGNSDDRRESGRVDAKRGLRVLVIDDSRTVVAALSHMLRQSGYVPTGANDAERGMELAATEQPDLIFLDIVLPGLNGFAALRRLRKDKRTRGIPVIMISGNPQAAEQFYVERIGADDFMKKPFGRAEVFSRIGRLVQAGVLPERDPEDIHSDGDKTAETEADSVEAQTDLPDVIEPDRAD